MTALPQRPRPVDPIPLGGRSRPWLWVALSGLAGALAVVVTFLLVRSRLGSQIPSHFGAFGQVTATMTPGALLTVSLTTELATGAGLSAVVYLVLRSGVIEHQHGPGFAPLFAELLSAVVLLEAVPWILLLTGGAGYSPAGGGLPGVARLLVVVPLLVLVVAFWRGRRRSAASAGGVQFECSSCGRSFSPSTAAWVLGPHIGGSVYLRCPACGERGWDRRAGTPYFPGRSGSDERSRSG
jgi:hypothetical protein